MCSIVEYFYSLFFFDPPYVRACQNKTQLVKILSDTEMSDKIYLLCFVEGKFDLREEESLFSMLAITPGTEK